MRQISIDAYNAFKKGKNFKRDNTQVFVTDNGAYKELILFGHKIARQTYSTLEINHCGWPTNTTRDRLNAFPDVNIRSFKGDFILNEKIIMKKGWYNMSNLEYYE